MRIVIYLLLTTASVFGGLSSFCDPAVARSSLFIRPLSLPRREFLHLLKNNSQWINVADYIEAQKGLLPRAWTTESLKESSLQIQTEQIHELTQGFLSPVRKQYLIDLLRLIPPERSKALKILDMVVIASSQQIEALHRPPHEHKGSLSPQLDSKEDGDRLYLNGIRYSFEEFKNIKLIPGIKYHLSLISEVFQPLFLWASAEELTHLSIQRVPLVKEDCSWNSFEELELEPLVVSLTTQKDLCVVSTKSSFGPSTIATSPPNPALESPSPSSFWDWPKKHPWGLATTGILGGLFLYEVHRHYEIRVNLGL